MQTQALLHIACHKFVMGSSGVGRSLPYSRSDLGTDLGSHVGSHVGSDLGTISRPLYESLDETSGESLSKPLTRAALSRLMNPLTTLTCSA